MRRSLFLTVIVLVAALFTLATGAQAQSVRGTIQGYVTDADGGALPGVPVTVDNVETGADRTVFTSESGFYAARALEPGTYDVSAAMDGMRDAMAEGVRLLVGQTVDINLGMVLDTVAEAITVTSSGVIEASRSAAASYIDAQEIENYPILGRDFKQFALLTPTVQNDPVRGFVTMAGQRGIYTGLNIDGTSGKNAFFGYGTGGEATENDGVVVAQESVQEFQVVTSGFSPEIGASGGGYINVITKSGTNNFKGSAFYLFTDDSLKADIPATPLDVSRGNSASTPVSEFERENLGFSVGGPIKKDKVHFFFTYDGTTRDEPFEENLRTRGAYDAVLLLGQTNPDFLAAARRLCAQQRRRGGARPGQRPHRQGPLPALGREHDPVRQGGLPGQRLQLGDLPLQLHRLRAHQQLGGRGVAQDRGDQHPGRLAGVADRQPVGQRVPHLAVLR